MERVLDVYKRPYDPMHPVICMDESPRQLITETRRPQPMVPGRQARFDYEYRRCGVCSVFVATEPIGRTANGQGLCYPNQGTMGSFSKTHCRSLARGRANYIGNGQLKYPHAGCTIRGVSSAGGKTAIGAIRVCVYTKAW